MVILRLFLELWTIVSGSLSGNRFDYLGIASLCDKWKLDPEKQS